GGTELLRGLGVVGGSFVVGQLSERPVAGFLCVDDRLGRIPRGNRGTRPMMGQGGQVIVEAGGVNGFDGLGHPTMEGDATGPGQLVVERRSHPAWGKAVAGPGASATEAA